MKGLCLMFIYTLMCTCVFAQTSLTVKHVATHVFDNEAINAKSKNAAFGGISAIEAIPAKDVAEICKTCDAAEGYFLFSDKKMGDKANAFYMERDFEIQHAFNAFDMIDVESVRWNSALQQLVYSYEQNEVTGVYAINIRTGEKNKIVEMPLPTDNRGIEALSFDRDNSLWIALETGNADCKDNTVSFYNIRYDSKTQSYNGKDTVAFSYPLDKCACLGDGVKNIDGTNGNGVTEILGIPELPEKLLVLERCFNKQTMQGSTYLYVATIDRSKRIISKDKMLFDFNTADFPSVGRNLEGICRAKGNRLLIVADDNFSTKQIGQVVELRMVFE